MTPLAFDFETALIAPGKLAPAAVCLTWQRPGMAAKICHASDAEPRLKVWLEDPDVLFVGANVSYDFGVVCANYPRLLPSVFAAYENDRVTDVQTRQKLLDIASGGYRGFLDPENKWQKRNYSLFDLTRRHTGRLLKKDGFRLFYQFFRGTPLSGWAERARFLQSEDGAKELTGRLTDEQIKELPGMLSADPSEVLTYPMEDAVATLDCFLVQDKHIAYLEDQFRQSRASWWLHLMIAWGVHTDAAAVQALEQKTREAYDEIRGRLTEQGFVREDGTRDTNAAKKRMVSVCEQRKSVPRLTPAGQICLDSDACEATEDPVLEDYAEFSTLSKVLKADVEMLRSGITVPIQPRYDLAETGRTTCSSPNIQNLRRLPGIRECFAPRKGKVFVQADYEGLELRTLAQVCMTLFGESRLAEMLNSGHDPHLEVARRILGTSYEEAKAHRKTPVVDNARQTGKVGNFGFPGGLGATRLCYFAKRSYDVILTEPEAVQLKEIWLQSFPEMRLYFAHIVDLELKTGDNKVSLEQLYTKRYRGLVSYTAACNSLFQGLGADCTKEAGWRISKACYTEPDSPLFGARIVMYIHDEFVLEVEEDRVHEAGQELVRHMVEGAGKYLTDVPATTEAVAMRYYSKNAYPIYRDGRLVPWNGEKKE